MIIEGIPKAVSLNTYRNAHYFKLNEWKQEHKTLVRMQMKRNDLRPLKTPVQITFTFNYKDKRGLRDLDNEIVSVKFGTDSLVMLGLLPDDKPEFINKITLSIGQKEDNTYSIIIKENE